MVGRSALFSLLAFILLTQAYQNCGGARQFSAMDSSYSESSVAMTPEEPATTTPPPSSNDDVPDQNPVSEMITTSFDYYLPFGTIADSMVGPLNNAVKDHVRNANCNDVADGQYRCGEIPVGTILDNNRKLLTTMDLGEKFEGRQGKKSYKFSSKNGQKILLNVYIDRLQRRGSQTLFYLPSQRRETLQTSPNLGTNVFFTLQPRGSFFDSQICTVIPGVDVELDKIVLSGEVRKADALPFGKDVKARGDIIIHPGQMTFDNAYVCGTLRVAFRNGTPYVTLEDLSDLRFQDITYKGLQVEKKIKVSGLLGFFDDLFDLGISDKFKSAIHAEVTKLVRREVQLTTVQVKNGTYLREYLDKAKLAPYIEKLNQQIQKDFAENGFVTEQADRVTQASCVSSFASLNLSNQALIDLTRICSFSPKIEIQAMYGAKDSSADCYKGYFDPRAGNSLGGTDWWRNSCKVILRTKVTLQNDLLPALSCFTEALKLKKLPAVHCQAALQEMLVRYQRGEYVALLNSLVFTPLTPAQLQEVNAVLQNQFSVNTLSANLLKRIFQ